VLNKYYVTLTQATDADLVRQSGCEILAEYPDAMVIRCEEEVAAQLRAAGVEINQTVTAPVRLLGMQFSMADAMATEPAAPVDDTRPHYYIAQLVGPAKGSWLSELAELGADVIASPPGDALILRLLPPRLASIAGLPWVDSIVSYRPAMKLSPKLRGGRRAALGPAELTMSAAEALGDVDQLVEITVFPGESVDAVAAKIEDAGGRVMSRTKTSVKAVAGTDAIEAVAEDPGVEAIQPFVFPELHNDVARTVMALPQDGAFRTGVLEGAGQIIAVCDSGIDTGAAATIHPDFQNRVEAIVSLPVALSSAWASYVNGPLNTDDGAADANSGHGTHVVGSVLGDGASALAAGSSTVPRGTAPRARLFFQASEQEVAFKRTSQLIAEGIPVPQIPGGWPPASVGLYGLPDDLMPLFTAAYAAGARIHTNSWGAPVNGEYTENARHVDQFMWENRDMLIVFSAGNSGTDVDQDGQINLDSIGSPGTAKNCLTVGASENQRPNGSVPAPGINVSWPQFSSTRFAQMGAAGHVSDNVDGLACFSSRGPTDDGRIKPEVVAPGTNVLSTRSTQVGADPLWGDVTPLSHPLRGRYCWSGGTSMSTPLVAGIAACVREHVVSQRNHFEDGVKPSGALIKAFIVNGAQAINGQFTGEVPSGANSVSGFGRVNATNTITPGQLGRAAFDDEPDNAVESGEMRTFAVEVASASESLKATLCWTDRESTNAGGLQNRLYLQVVSPNGAIIDGDVTPFPTVTNNVQQVTVEAPVAGQYTIRVRGVSVVHQAPGAGAGANPRQDFALVVSNGFGLNVGPAPAVLAGGIVSAASFVSGPVSAGELLSIFGSNLGPTPPRTMEFDLSGNLTTQLGVTRVLFDGQAAPLIFASEGQLNVVAPGSIAGQASTVVEVEVDGIRSTPTVLPVAGTRPGIFVLNAAGQGAVLNENFSVNGPANPAARGTVIQIFATGGGETAPPFVTGGVAPSPPPLHVLSATVQVEIGGMDAPVVFAGASPQSVFGLVQINATVPAGVTPGAAVGLVVRIGGVGSRAGVTVAVV
jgi:uncharacterized protein (TIGR03437 family)